MHAAAGIDLDESVLDLDTIDLPVEGGPAEDPPLAAWDLRRPPSRAPSGVPAQDDDTQRTDTDASARAADD